MTVYSSPQRDAVLRLCGWKGEAVISPHAPSDHLAATARRAAVAIFQVKIFVSRLSLENNELPYLQLDLRRALRELQQGAARARGDGNAELASLLTMVSMAVSGFSSEDQWREMVTKIWPKNICCPL